MAKSGSCPTQDLANCAPVHNPPGFCLDLDNHVGKDKDGQDDDGEVELAEEVGEDVLLVNQAGDGQDNNESEAQREWEETGIVQVALANELLTEVEEQVGMLEEKNEGEVKIPDEEPVKTDKQSKIKEDQDECKEESEETETVTEVTDKQEEEGYSKSEEIEQNELRTCSETEVSKEFITEEDMGFQNEIMSFTGNTQTLEEVDIPENESEENKQLSVDYTSENLTDKSDAFEVIADPSSGATVVSIVTDEVVNNQSELYQTSAGISDGADDQNNIFIPENQENQVKNHKEEFQQSNNNITWQQETIVRYEEETEFMTDKLYTSDDVPDSGSAETLHVEPLQFVAKDISQTEGRIEVTISGETGHTEEEVKPDEIVTLDGENKTMEEEETADDFLIEKLRGENEQIENSEMKNGSSFNSKLQDITALQGSLLQCSSETLSVDKIDADCNQMDTAFGEKEVSKDEPQQPEEQMSAHENDSFKTHDNIFQKAFINMLVELKGNLKVQPEEKDLVEDKNKEQEMMVDTEMTETQTSKSHEQRPITAVAPPEDAIMWHNDEKCHKYGDETMEHSKEKYELRKDEAREDVMDDKPKEEQRAVEAGEQVQEAEQTVKMIFSLETPSPQEKAFDIENTTTTRNNSGINKIEQGTEERSPETREWRKDLKPVKKDLVTVGAQKELVKKEASTSLPQREDWLKELKSVIKDDSWPKRMTEPTKKRQVVLLEDGHMYIPQREDMDEDEEKQENLVSHRKLDSPVSPMGRNSRPPGSQHYEIALYVKVIWS